MALPDLRILIRAWAEHDGPRMRIITDHDGRRQWVVGSTGEACAIVEMLLGELDFPATRANTHD
jgi:hypothetical protein